MNRMGIAEREEELFQRWAPTRPGFVRDGVIDPAIYRKSSPSILILLKEVNDPGPDGGGWDLREFVRDGARHQTWNTVTRWVMAISSLPGEKPWRDVYPVSTEQRRDVLRNISAMNLKKSPGGDTTVVANFRQVVEEDRAFIREQIGLYNPQIIICCGSIVADVYYSFLKPEDSSSWQSTTRGVEFLTLASGCSVISYSHPEARISGNLLHYGLVDAVREIRGNTRTG